MDTSEFDRLFPHDTSSNPWIFQTEEPLAFSHRDACIGNGLIGTRVNAWGTGDGYRPGSASFMAGLWGAATENPDRPQGLIELPHWCTLQISDVDRELRRSTGEVSNHHQSLDMKTGTVSTEWTDKGVLATLGQSFQTWIARDDAHIGVIQADATVEDCVGDDVSCFVDEVLDALHIPGVENTSVTEDGDDLVLDLTSSLFGTRIVVRSRIGFNDLPAESIQVNISSDTKRAVRRFTLKDVPKGETFRVEKMVSIVSSKQHADPFAESKRTLDKAFEDTKALRTRHEEAWERLWQGRVESDHLLLQQLATSSLYHLYCSVREGMDTSHGPCGLFGNGWDGHVFWDTELWTHPALALFAPDLAKNCAGYRVQTLAGARINAERENESGARYGWMTGETGEECCSYRTFQEERHIVSCVALGQWLYAVAAGDEDWLRGEGLEVMQGCAEYWVSRAVKAEDGSYHILNVCGSDEHAGRVDDNATTNWGAKWTLRKAAELTRQAGGEVPLEWEEVAEGLVILWHEKEKIPLQMKEWSEDQVIKQADTTMLVHPWHFPMEEDVMERMVDYYRTHYEDQPIMMGYAIDGILDCRLGREKQVTETLDHLLAYFRPPYLVTTEAPTNERLVFITGMGGFLQFIAMGMAGLMTDEWNELRSDWACLPDGVNELVLHGIVHRGNRHSVRVVRDEKGSSSVTIEHKT